MVELILDSLLALLEDVGLGQLLILPVEHGLALSVLHLQLLHLLFQALDLTIEGPFLLDHGVLGLLNLNILLL